MICPRYESRQKLVGQETENEMVRKEFEALRSDSWKQIFEPKSTFKNVFWRQIEQILA